MKNKSYYDEMELEYKELLIKEINSIVDLLRGKYLDIEDYQLWDIAIKIYSLQTQNDTYEISFERNTSIVNTLIEISKQVERLVNFQ